MSRNIFVPVGFLMILLSNFLCGQGHIYIGIMIMHGGVFVMMFSDRTGA